MKGKMIATFLALLVAIAVASPGFATPQLDFDVTPGGPGSISYAGGANPLVGTGIRPTTITGLGTPANNGMVLGCVSCSLSFTTGNLVSTTSTSWTFGGGGSLSLVGGTSGGLVLPAGTLLVRDDFTSATVSALGSGTFKVAIADFKDQKNERLAAFFGLPGGFGPGAPLWDGSFNISFNAAGSPPGGFSSTSILSGDIVNSIPEPTSMLLLGSGLVGLVAAGLKKRA